MDGALVVELAGTVQYARRRSVEADRAMVLALAACRHPANGTPMRQSAARSRLRAARALAVARAADLALARQVRGRVEPGMRSA